LNNQGLFMLILAAADKAVFAALQGVSSLLHISGKQRHRAQKCHIPQGCAPNKATLRNPWERDCTVAQHLGNPVFL